jgi:hypothetical protein
MKIKELIKKLSKFDENLVVLIPGYEDGYNTPKELSEITVVKDNALPNNTWYYSEYSVYDLSDKYQKNYKPISAICL